MKIGILSGAVKNAGDFLIVSRSEQLLRNTFCGCEFITFNRLKCLEDRIEEINSCNLLVLAGGPVYLEQTYPEAIPFVNDLSKINIPMITLGCGWYGKNDLSTTVYEDYRFSENTKKFLDKLNKNVELTCRDWLTYKILKNNGYDDILMTGCPAWYDAEKINISSHKSISIQSPKKICISDSGYTINIARSLKLTKYIRKRYPKSEIHFIFHRGIDVSGDRGKRNLDLFYELKKIRGIVIHDISDSIEGFSIYDDCDLHIGFRVHAHIYNLSIRNISILLEEDGRGHGINDSLYLKGIRLYSYVNLDGKTQLLDNDYFLSDIDYLLNEIETTDFIMYDNAYGIMKKYYAVMMNYLNKIKKRIEKNENIISSMDNTR